MRKLHPVGSQEHPLDEGHLVRRDGAREHWTVHAAAPGRTIVRVEVQGDDTTELWHLVLGDGGRPERMQARIRAEGRTLETTATFFGDEVLMWRKGGGEPSESIPLPPECGLLWPPIAGRERCLAAASGRQDEGADVSAETRRRVHMLFLTRVPIAEGGVAGRPVGCTVRAGRRSIALSADGMPDMDMRADMDDDGRLVRWADGEHETERASHE